MLDYDKNVNRPFFLSPLLPPSIEHGSLEIALTPRRPLTSYHVQTTSSVSLLVASTPQYYELRYHPLPGYTRSLCSAFTAFPYRTLPLSISSRAVRLSAQNETVFSHTNPNQMSTRLQPTPRFRRTPKLDEPFINAIPYRPKYDSLRSQ